jgi:F0F1-type ATP synthase assembly protein I
MFGKPVNHYLLARILAISAVGVEMVTPAVIGLAVDYRFGTSPWGLIVGVLIGFVGALYHLVLLSKPGAAEDSSREKPSS